MTAVKFKEYSLWCVYVYNALSYITKDLISDRMTIYIIDRLEKIKIHKNHCKCFSSLDSHIYIVAVNAEYYDT